MNYNGASKADRLLQLEVMLLQHPEGLTQAELAKRLGVHRSTINRYLPSLPGHIYVDDLDLGKLKIDRTAYLVNVRFSLHEAMAIHLATRLLSTTMPDHNPHGAAALRKLSTALERLAPQISLHMGKTADQMDTVERKRDNSTLENLQKLTLAWAELRKTKVLHLHSATSETFEYRLEPYFIEPYSAGHSIEIIGRSQSLRGEPRLRTFKLERIQYVELLDEHYQIPETFNLHKLLKDAWGIWYTNKPPVRVLLKFSPKVAQRVQQTCWHQSQKIYENDDGSIIWEGEIAEPKEMHPWIRAWAGDCEVLAPASLREVMINESQKWHAVYHERKEDDIPNQ